ncbi:putative transposase [Lentzea nigeriaca]|nr:putative transposase [Lentzea nigeriaca]
MVQQQVIRDFGASRAKALKDVRERVPQWRRAGMPRFKKRSLAEPTFNYTQRGFRLRDGVLHLAGGIAVRPVWSRDLPSVPSSVRVYRDSLGHWYCSFVVQTRVQPLPATGRVIGVDWGVKELATTTSDAHDLPHPQHGKNAAQGLARYQRMMARRRPTKGQPGSKGYQKARRQAAKIQKKVARRRQTPPASGPSGLSATMTRSPWRISGRSSWRNPRWHAKPRTPRSAPPSVS